MGQREEKQKNMISGQIFSFPNFSNFWKFRNKFWYQLKQILPINYQHFGSYAIFCQNFDTLKNRFKVFCHNFVTTGISFDMYL